MKQQTQTNKIEWREIELGTKEFFEIKKGSSITKDKVSQGKIPVIAGGQQPAYYHNKSNRPGETITISGSGAYAGFVNYFKEPIFASDCSTVQIKNNLISSKYPYLFLKFYQSKIYSMQKGIAQPHVYPKDIVKIKIPLPFSDGKLDIKEQERIVAILEKAEKQKEKNKNANDMLDEYLKSVFNEMFGNPHNPTSKFERIEFSKCLEKGASNNNLKLPGKDFLEKGKYPIIDQGEKFIAGYTNDNLKVYNKKFPVIIFGDHTRILKFVNFPFALGADGVKILVPKNNFNPYYFYYCLKLINIKSAGYSRHYKFLKYKKIPLPPLPLQQKFANLVEKVEKMKENVNKNKKCSEELFNSLMQKAFRGEL